MSKVEIRLPYVDYVDRPLVCPEESLTKQSFADECDFNAVMSRWERTGVIEHVNASPPQYADVSDLVDYQTALNTVMSARTAFDGLPSAVRERFGNNPGALLAFLNDPNNRDEGVSLGLIDDKGGGAKSPSKGSVAPPPEPPKEA